MSGSSRAWCRAALASTLLVLAAATPALATTGRGRGHSAAATGIVVARARFEPLDAAAPVGVEGLGDYRGALVVGPDRSGLAVVNDVGVEDYIRGISEMPPEWPQAALQAQAIAARSFLLHRAAAPGPDLTAIGAQICADDACQVYRGLTRERAPGADAWSAAVTSTAGQVLVAGGQPINALYSSSNGGRSVSGGVPYLPAVDDPDDALSPLHHWTATVDGSDLAAALGLPGRVSSIRRDGDSVTVATSVDGGPSPQPAGPGTAPTTSGAPSPTSTTAAAPVGPGPRAATMAADGSGTTTSVPETSTTEPPTSTTVGSGGSPQPSAPPSSAPPARDGGGAPPSGPGTPPSGSSASPGSGGATSVIAAPDLTAAVNGALAAPAGRSVLLPSARFGVAETGGTVTFDGIGFGHGMGMSQYGALGKARRGWSADAILAAYYGGLRPAPAGAAGAGNVRVALQRDQAAVTITGRFRLVDDKGTTLITVADGPWRVVPDGPDVRVVPPPGYDEPFTVAPHGVDPAIVLPGAHVTALYSLPVPAVVTVSADLPDHTHVDLGPVVASAGLGSVMLPPPPAAGPYRVVIDADAGAGRSSAVPITFVVGAVPAAVPTLTRFGVSQGPTGSTMASASAFGRVAVASIALLALVAVVVGAIGARVWRLDVPIFKPLGAHGVGVPASVERASPRSPGHAGPVAEPG